MAQPQVVTTKSRSVHVENILGAGPAHHHNTTTDNQRATLRSKVGSLERPHQKTSVDTVGSFKLAPKGNFSLRSTSVEKGSRASTQQSTPEKSKNDEMQLASEIQKNLLQRSEVAQASPLAHHDISWDYRTKMVDWMVEVCHSFKTSERAYFLSVALFDAALRKYK